MALRFPYRRVPLPRPIASLGGRRYRPRTIIRVTVIGPAGTRVENALLDTGADDTVFPLRIARALGLDLGSAPTGEASGAGQVTLPVRYALVVFRVTDGREMREWTAWVGFVDGLKHSLLGYAGFLQFFSAHFHGHLEEVELTVNPTYPGT